MKMKPFNCLLLVLSFSLAASIHWFAQSYCETIKCKNAEITPFIPVLAGRNLHMSQTPSHQRRDAWPTNCTPLMTLILPLFFYTSGTLALVLNFEVGHFARHFLFLSFFLPFGVATKGIHSTQLHCYISFLSFVRLTTCFFCFFLSSRGRLLDSHKRRLLCLHIQHATRCLFERRIPVSLSEAAVSGFYLSISPQKISEKVEWL